MGGCFTKYCDWNYLNNDHDDDSYDDIRRILKVSSNSPVFLTPFSSPMHSPIRSISIPSSPGDIYTTPPIQISMEMSSPTVIGTVRTTTAINGSANNHDNKRGRTIGGRGLALARTPVERGGAAYWEWHVKKGRSSDIMFGVSIKRTPQFYEILAHSDGSASSLIMATKMMRPLAANVTSGDVIGVAIAFINSPSSEKRSKKPPPSSPSIVQLYVNGDKVEEFALGRVRGNYLFPSIYLPPPQLSHSDTSSNGDLLEMTFVHDEAHFRHVSPQASFVPLCRGGDERTIV